MEDSNPTELLFKFIKENNINEMKEGEKTSFHFFSTSFGL